MVEAKCNQVRDELEQRRSLAASMLSTAGDGPQSAYSASPSTTIWRWRRASWIAGQRGDDFTEQLRRRRVLEQPQTPVYLDQTR